MMAFAWRIGFLVIAILSTTCMAFLPPRTPQLTVTRPLNARTALATTSRITTGERVGDNCRLASMSVETDCHDRSREYASTIAAMTILAGPIAPAYADGELTALVGSVVNSPAILAIPIVLGFLVATSVALLIYTLSQPRERD
ncbi:unnamed protein product [Choristocarpus tenellus]